MTKVHSEAVRFAREDYDILLIGHEGHEEVEGTAGEAPEHIQLVQRPDDADTVEVRDPAKVVWLSQTTLSVDETMETVARCASASPRCRTRPATTSATPPRTGRPRSRRSPRSADLVIVVGLGELLELRAAGRGGPGVRREGRLPRGLRGRDRAVVAGRRRDGRRDQRRVGARRCSCRRCCDLLADAATAMSKR